MPDLLSVYAQSRPEKLAVVDDKPDGTVLRWTYAELEAQANRVANLLLALGARPGTKVLWCGPNSPEVVAVMSASRKIGTVAVPLNYRLTPEEARYVINHSDAEVAYVDHEYVPLFAALRDRGELEKVRHIIAVRGPGGPRRPAGPVRLPPRRRVHHLGSAVSQRTRRVHGRRPALRPDGRRAAQVRRRGLAAAGG